MARFKGTRGDDFLDATSLDDRITGGLGDDRTNGEAGNDFIRGDAGDDGLVGGDGSDLIFGGRGADRLYDEVSPFGAEYLRDQLWGGVGNDYIEGGVGFDLLVGGSGDDVINMLGGQAFGDEGPGKERRAAGGDVIATDLALDYGTSREMTGGLGADVFGVTMSAGDESTHVEITDFQPGQDVLVLSTHVTWEETPRIAFAPEFFAYLDANGDGRLAAGDNGVTAGENSLTITFGNDSVTLQGASDYVF